MSIIENECKEIIEKLNFEKLKNKSILITGGSGLVGLYLVNCLRQIKENLNLKISVWVKNEIEKNFETLFENCQLIKGDITDTNLFNTLPSYDYIIHSAGYGQPNKFMDDKIKTISLNTTATINLFKKLNINGSFLFMSTSELYNGLDNEFVKEYEIGSSNTDHPRGCYIESKRCGEAICHSYSSTFNVKIARLSLAYGPGTKINDQRVLNSLIQKGLENDKIELLDDGSAIRTYCYITDVIEMLFNIILHGKKVVYNIGGESKISIFELSNLIGQQLKKNIVLPILKKEIIGSPKVVNISTERYKKEFLKNNFVDLESGLIKTISWQKQLYEKNT
jgi:nucleoside-diphosphate-sugar epimerase